MGLVELVVRFVGRSVGRKWFGGEDGGDLDRGLPPCWFGWSAACAEARLSFALGRGWVSLVEFGGCHVSSEGFDRQWIWEARMYVRLKLFQMPWNSYGFYAALFLNCSKYCRKW